MEHANEYRSSDYSKTPMACNFCSPHPSNDYICAGAKIKWPYVAKVNMSLDKDTGLWELEDKDVGCDTWEWVTTLKPMDVNFVCGSTDKVPTRIIKKRARRKEKNIGGGRKRGRK